MKINIFISVIFLFACGLMQTAQACESSSGNSGYYNYNRNSYSNYGWNSGYGNNYNNNKCSSHHNNYYKNPWQKPGYHWYKPYCFPKPPSPCPKPTPAPEPASTMLFLAGAGTMAAKYFRKNRVKA